MKGMKIKISDNGNISVWLPYKNGLVGWELSWGVGHHHYEWYMINRPNLYNPNRVGRAHSQFLRGVGLGRKLERSAAATHNWLLLANLRKVHKRKADNRLAEIEYNTRIMLERD